MQISDQIQNAIRGSKPRAFLSDSINEVLFDVVMSDTESDTMQVTRHAIEEGSDVTDHVIEAPKEFSLDAVLTDDDLNLLDPNSFKNKKVSDRLKIIQGWIDNKTVLSYYGHDVDLSYVVIQSINRVKAQDTGEGIKVSISLTKITIAKSQTTEVSVKTTTAKGKTAKQTDSKSGEKSTAENKSWLSTLTS